MLVDEACAVVDLVVDNDEEVLLGGVLGDVRVGEFLGRRHCEVVCEACKVLAWYERASLRGWQRVSRSRMRGVEQAGVVEETRCTRLQVAQDYLTAVERSGNHVRDGCACEPAPC